MSAHTSARSPVGQPRRLYCWAAALSCSDRTAETEQSVTALLVVSLETVRNGLKSLQFCSWNDVIRTNRSWEWEHLTDNRPGTHRDKHVSRRPKIQAQPRDVPVFTEDVTVATAGTSHQCQFSLISVFYDYDPGAETIKDVSV